MSKWLGFLFLTLEQSNTPRTAIGGHFYPQMIRFEEEGNLKFWMHSIENAKRVKMPISSSSVESIRAGFWFIQIESAKLNQVALLFITWTAYIINYILVNGMCLGIRLHYKISFNSCLSVICWIKDFVLTPFRSCSVFIQKTNLPQCLLWIKCERMRTLTPLLWQSCGEVHPSR